jgi:hypothetical protein
MLRVTITDTPIEQRWTLQGRMVGPWVAELRSSWKRASRQRENRKCVVDLSEVTLIDKHGERMLRMMADAGVQFVACGVYTKHVVENLKTQGKRRCCNFIAWLFALVWLVIVPTVLSQAPAFFPSEPGAAITGILEGHDVN